MRSKHMLAVGIAGLALMGGCALRPQPAIARQEPAANNPLALVVSWDGAKASAVEALLREGRLPVLQGLMDRGAWTLRARTIFPSITLPAHTSMLTGVGPERHGVTWNRYGPERGAVAVSTIFEIAETAGIPTVLLCGKEKFRHLVKPGAPRRFIFMEEGTEAIAREAAKLLHSDQPGLLFLHLGAPDEAGHEFGWGNQSQGIPPSAEFLAALEACDRATGLLVEAAKREGRWGETALLLTADHGGHDKTHGSASDEDALIPWIAAGGQVQARGELQSPVVVEDTAAAALQALGLAVPPAWTGKAPPLFIHAKARKAA